MIRRFIARLRAMLKYQTTRLNSLNEPVTDTMLDVKSVVHSTFHSVLEGKNGGF
jgi:hypothetical protein